MSVGLLERPATGAAPIPPSTGGIPARRAVVRWAWRLFRREWRQQLLILLLIVVAVGAVLVGATVATDTPSPPGASFGTAQDMATLPGGSGAAGPKAGGPRENVPAAIAAINRR